VKTKIEWADDTENLASGCSEAVLPSGKMDPACVNCYARLQSARCASMGQALYDGVADRSGNTARWSGVFRWDPAMLKRKFNRMKGGHRVFLGSMTDLWHDQHDPALLVALAHEIRRLGDRKPEQRPHLITLTKRADRLLAWQREHFPDGLPAWVWPGVTAGCQDAADLRVPLLLQVKAKGPRVVSVEPMTGPVDVSPWMPSDEKCEWVEGGSDGPVYREGTGRFTGVGWVIAGGESGAKARPSHPDWFRALRDQCVASGVPFHFKQHGMFLEVNADQRDPETGGHVQLDPAHPDDAALFIEGQSVGISITGDIVRRLDDMRDDVAYRHMKRADKHQAGRTLDGRTYDEVPHV